MKIGSDSSGIRPSCGNGKIAGILAMNELISTHVTFVLGRVIRRKLGKYLEKVI